MAVEKTYIAGIGFRPATGGGGGGGSVSDTAYGVGWNGDTTTAPSRNAVYDKIQPIVVPSTVSVDVNFGSASGGEGDIATATVSASWVGASSKIICAPFAVATADHDPEDYALEGITAYATNISAGVGFDVIARAPNNTFGTYTIHCMGL